MKVTEKKNTDLTSLLTIHLEKADFENHVNKSLKHQAKNASIKGFRQGKVPTNLIKKMYGNAILADEVNKLVSDAIHKHLQDNKIDILGQPLPVKSDWQPNIYELENLSFDYKIGVKPTADISFLEDEPSYTKHEIEIDEEMIQKEVDHMLGQYGDVENPEGKPEGKDAIEVTLTELDEEGNVKEEGYQHTTSFGFDQLKLKKDQKAIGKLNVGDTYSPFNVYRAFDKEKEDIAKQILELDADVMDTVGKAFELKLVQINRVSKAELNQDFFDKVYGKDNVKSEKEMHEKIRENLANYLNTASDNYLKNDIYKSLMEEAKIELPEEFLQEWLFASKEDDSITEEDIQSEFTDFAKSLKSSLIFNAVAEKAGIEVTFEELKDKVKSNLIQQFQYYGMPLTDNEEMLEGMIQRFMSDEKQVRQTQDQIMDEKIFEYLKDSVKVDSKTVSLEEFNALNENNNEGA